MKKIVLLSFLFLIIFVQGCRTRHTVMTWNANKYRYKFTAQDDVYLRAFTEQDSLQLAQKTNIKYLLTVDSLIIYENPNIKKFYKDKFELYEYLFDLDYNLYLYDYSGAIIKMCNYHGKNLNFERVNINGKLHLLNVNIGNDF